MDQKQNTEIQLEKQYWFLDNWLKVNEGITDKLKRSEILYGFGEFYKKKKEEEQKCWTCDASVATHKTYRDALGEFELTCDKCHREEYPEEYEEEDKQCRDCEIEAKKHCDECGGYGSDDDDDEEEEEEDYNTQTSPPYYCDGGCGKKVGEGHDHDCDRVCPDCKEEEE